MSDVYILLKDLPNSKAGDSYWFVEGAGRYYRNGIVTEPSWGINEVENNSSWFRKVIYTIEDAAIYIENYRRDDSMTSYRMANDLGFGNLKLFEPLKQPSGTPQINKTIVQSESVEERAYATNLTHVEKPSEKMFTIQDMEQCWNKARETGGVFSGMATMYKFKHEYFSDYIKSK